MRPHAADILGISTYCEVSRNVRKFLALIYGYLIMAILGARLEVP